MPKEWFVEMTWRCSSAHVNKGEDTVCTLCGEPKKDVDADEMPADSSYENRVTEQKKIAHAREGAMWKCRFCGSAERRGDGNCAQCGVDQVTGEKKDSMPPAVASRLRVQASAYEGRSALHRTRFWFLMGSAALGFILCAWLLFRTKELHGNVTALGWDRTIHLERYSLHHEDGWTVPTGGQNIVNDGTRFHYTRFHVDTGRTRTVTDKDICGTKNCRKGPPHDCVTPKPSCTKQKNGFARCTQGDPVCRYDTFCDAKTCEAEIYTDIPVFDTFYEWDAWRWAPTTDLKASGSTLQVSWPVSPPAELLGPGEQIREAGRDETYTVSLTGRKGDTWTYHPANESEFLKFPMQSRHLMDVNAFGSVTVKD